VKTAAYIVWALAELYLLILLARMILDLVMAFSRTWRPEKTLAAAAEIVFLLTDPLLRPVRKAVKPVRLGPFALDLSFVIVFLAVSLVAYGASRVVLSVGV
jgi:YggT family protein